MDTSHMTPSNPQQWEPELLQKKHTRKYPSFQRACFSATTTVTRTLAEPLRHEQVKILAHAKLNGQSQNGKLPEKGPEFDKILFRGEKRLGAACPGCCHQSHNILRGIAVMVLELPEPGNRKPLLPQGLAE